MRAISKLRSTLFTFRLPNLSPSMQCGRVLRLHVKEGDLLPAYGLFADVETQELTEGSRKSVQLEIELQDELHVAKLFTPPSSCEVPVGTLLALLTEDIEDIPHIRTIQSDDLQLLDNKAVQQVLWQAYVKNAHDANQCGL